ncbi:MAG: 1-deoxy-D-xylulose-5-phosphate reductoisomerase, partial [Desulfuromonadales bacterium]|nr:1-deoxy-D-xylulose-5-phosphate reductoisomerase [Desulfuromonadales bacterium]NIS41825.1 1-deoxy-D-xylulose-5-phosphate reductoisomerase [Desulfuromonadales bacterium]
LAILGSTGSIGVSTLEIVAAHPDRFRVVAMTAGYNLDLFLEQVKAVRPEVVAVVNPADADTLRQILGADAPEILSGVEGLIACASHGDVDMVVSAIVGAAGLVPTMAAIETGKDVALANKETLVTAGALVMDAVAAAGIKLYPVDSEHSAIFQSLEGHREKDVRRLILTASGGPFRDRAPKTFADITLQDALNHPNWDMGRKITIDSATMMNKGLEVIEAHWLFDLPGGQIDVHIHPQSIVHSMVEYVDGSVIAQLGIPDMKTPIAYALSYPERLPLDLPALDLC